MPHRDAPSRSRVPHGRQWRAFWAPVLLLGTFLFSSCSPRNCDYCLCDSSSGEHARNYWYNVALVSAIVDPCSGASVQSLVTPWKPETVPGRAGGSVLRLRVPCAGSGDCGGEVMELPMDNVRELTFVSDPLTPPKVLAAEPACINCTRVRDGWLVFDKIELRGMAGYRGKQSSVFYPSQGGGTLYEPETFGFDRGGTEITVGGELALLWDVLRFNATDVLHLGIMGGVWPSDGSTFVPLSFHPRVTFNNVPDPYGCSCNAWYLFGDAGFVNFDGTGAPYTPILDKRFFWGLGIGYEWMLGRDVDFGIDVGFRVQRLPLPPIDCCPDIPAEDRNPIRRVTTGFLRLGLTF